LRIDSRLKKLTLWVLVVAILFTGIIASAETLEVCRVGCDYNTIQIAINDSSPGDTITVKNGEYVENLVITKPITIRGTRPEWTGIKPSVADKPAVQVNTVSGKVTLENFTVNGNESTPVITVAGEADLTFKNCRVLGGRTAVSINNRASVRIANSSLSASRWGLRVAEKSEATVSDTAISGNESGATVSDSSVLTLINSRLENNTGPGITVTGTALANVLSAIIEGNSGAGVKMADFSRLNMKESQVNANSGGGILLSDSANAQLNENEMINNGNKNLSVISEKCGFSGSSDGFYGVVTGRGNKIVPANSTTICPDRFRVVNTNSGGTYSYLFRPTTLAFIGLIGAATAYFLVSG